MSQTDNGHQEPDRTDERPGPAAPSSHLEVERKFKVHGLYRLPDLVQSGSVGAASDQGLLQLDATYYDTDDLRLAREGITLRRRLGGDDEGWHLKLPSGVADRGNQATRQELHVPLAADDPALPDQAPIETPIPALVDLVRAIVRDDLVRPVATLRTERRVLMLSPKVHRPAPAPEDAAGEPPAPVLLLTDDVVSVLDAGGDLAARFRELELEDLPGVDAMVAAETARAVSEVLVIAGAIGGAFVSKAIRALGPFAAAPPEVPEPAAATPDDPAAQAIQAHLARHTRALRAADLMVRRDLPDAVHQARVACRRLRSGLKVFGPLLDTEWAERLRAELSWAAGELGDYRDTEVLLERLIGDLARLDSVPSGHIVIDDTDARAFLVDALTTRLQVARTRAMAMLGSKRYLDLHASLVLATADPHLLPAAQRPSRAVLPPLVVKAWGALARESERLLADERSKEGGAPDREWHRSRITAKKARYAVEACAPVFGAEAAAMARQLARVTEVLGDHQDCAIAQDRISELATGSTEPAPSPSAAFALGALLAVERMAADRCRDDFATIWSDVRRRRWRRWLET